MSPSRLAWCRASMFIKSPGMEHVGAVTACISDQPAFVALLKELGCDTTRKTKDGETGEQLAKRKGNRKVLEQLRTAQ